MQEQRHKRVKSITDYTDQFKKTLEALTYDLSAQQKHKLREKMDKLIIKQQEQFKRQDDLAKADNKKEVSTVTQMGINGWNGFLAGFKMARANHQRTEDLVQNIDNVKMFRNQLKILDAKRTVLINKISHIEDAYGFRKLSNKDLDRLKGEVMSGDTMSEKENDTKLDNLAKEYNNSLDEGLKKLDMPSELSL